MGVGEGRSFPTSPTFLTFFFNCFDLKVIGGGCCVLGRGQMDPPHPDRPRNSYMSNLSSRPKTQTFLSVRGGELCPLQRCHDFNSRSPSPEVFPWTERAPTSAAGFAAAFGPGTWIGTAWPTHPLSVCLALGLCPGLLWALSPTLVTSRWGLRGEA